MPPPLPSPPNHLPPPPLAYSFNPPGSRTFVPSYTQAPSDGSFILPLPNNGLYAQPTQLTSHLSQPGLSFESPYPQNNLAPELALPHSTQTDLTPFEKPKVKPKPKAAPASKSSTKVTKGKNRQGSAPKTKLRPQSSKHLTPSLRAAIITLKVTNPNRSFKEIGDLLAIPQDYEDDDEVPPANVEDDEGDGEDGDGDGGNAKDAVEDGTNGVEQQQNGAIGPASSELANLDPTTDPALLNMTAPDAAAGTSDLGNPTENGTSTNANSTNNRPPKVTKSSNKKKRRPIPRNTVAGIYKRAVERAGTETDLWKLLHQTGRRPGSGRPKKGMGKKDLDRAAAENAVEEANWRAELEGVAAGAGGVSTAGEVDALGVLGGLDTDGMGDGMADGIGPGHSMHEDVLGEGDMDGLGMDSMGLGHPIDSTDNGGWEDEEGGDGGADEDDGNDDVDDDGEEEG